MASLRRSKTMPADGQTAKFLYTIIKQLDLKSIDWNLVASQLDITNGHAARMRYSRFKQHMEGTPSIPRTARPKKSKSEKGEKGEKMVSKKRHIDEMKSGQDEIDSDNGPQIKGELQERVMGGFTNGGPIILSDMPAPAYFPHTDPMQTAYSGQGGINASPAFTMDDTTNTPLGPQGPVIKMEPEDTENMKVKAEPGNDG